MEEKILIIGAGITGITLAEKFSNQGIKVDLVEKRDHIGGNCYDYVNEEGIIIQKYGPHIFHTNDEEVWEYVSRFTKWIIYEHKVLGMIKGKYLHIPFNLTNLGYIYSKEKALKIKEKMVKNFGYGEKIPILDLIKTKDKSLKSVADYIYKNIFLNYTRKQWGISPKEINPSVIARVPITISNEKGYFNDKYQVMPKKGFSKMFEKMLENKNIKIFLNSNHKRFLKRKNEYNTIYYTGRLDEFFNYKYGILPYRHAQIILKRLQKESFQPVAVVNYPNAKKFTRITEFKKFYNKKSKTTTIGVEYPGKEGFEAWPILTEENGKILRKYLKIANSLKSQSIFLLGRLAEYKYYNMDEAVKRALDVFKGYQKWKVKN